jgi:hypothetical protein
MSLTITAEQRDALYDQVLDRLSGIGDIEIAIGVKDYDTAERLGREFSDDLRLLLDDLGLGESNGEPVALSSPPEVLLRVLPRLLELAEAHSSALDEEVAEAAELKSRNRLVADACKTVLAELDRKKGGQ